MARRRQDNHLDQSDLFTSPNENTTGWLPPEEFPRLSGRIALDLETKDPHLKLNGPGWPTRAGHVAGVSIATAEWSRYFPVAHAPGGNLASSVVWRWLRDQLTHVDQVVLHNAAYDLGWLRTVEVQLPDRVRISDTQAMAALLNENRSSYKLDKLGEDYLGQKKATSLLEDYAKRWGLGDAGSNIWRMPPFIVGPYAEQDARLTYDLATTFEPMIAAEHLGEVLQLEMDLVPVLVAMRARGLRIDVDGVTRQRDLLLEQEADLRDAIKTATKIAVDPWDTGSCAQALGARGIKCPLLQNGAPSVTKEFLEACHDPVAGQILALRRVNKLRSGFLEGAFLAHLQGDRIYPEFHPLRSDDGGAVTGRFSSSNPNAQQFPARREDDARLIRGLILPEDGQIWYAGDYNQQEPRMLVHFASLMQLRGAELAAEAYRRDPRTDFHQFVSDLTGLIRKVAKNINLGKFYGMGSAKYAKSVGLPTEWITRNGRRIEIAGPEAQAQLDQYNARLPFVKEIYDIASQTATERGYIRTIAGRRRRFQPIFERGASAHKALNAIIQGSSADQNKRAMVALHRASHTPSAAVHDELDGSTEPSFLTEIQTIMQDCLSLNVPSIVDLATGANWGEAA